MLWFDVVEYVFVFCLDREIEGQERDILQHLFSDHVRFVCLHLLIMLESSGWGHSFVHISSVWIQGGS